MVERLASSGTRTILAAAICLVIGLGLWMRPPLGAGAAAEAREIVLVARGMAYHVEGTSERNPTIRLAAGETVRLVLRNEEPGVRHDLVIPALGVELPGLRANETAETLLTAPARPGRYEYSCTPHGQMMRGVLEIGPEARRAR